ncbi:hypothetical protein [Aeromicrobium chenweiae]|uniref:Uncharacterized protein n=1 Tax=Aeromicrobium chenweiae TaxID=2079793 RepID=A0A2S0WKJ8_9ACTN|nr:hypothetical protein [Aeromicrobium chenweiae]AWB91866.1 hypothetical protein C3E78_06440 [Aeromicrobium chenweiae]TGN32714.1 hypothetical protein E4L97_08410 [Aeromicrobium chenweiae]
MARWTRRGRLAAGAVLLVLLTACSADEDKDEGNRTYQDEHLVCDHDFSSDDDKDTVERIGGLVTDDFVVKLTESTRLGVVALVEGDTRKAFDELHEAYGVAVVARLEEDGARTVSGLGQVRELVAAACGEPGRG